MPSRFVKRQIIFSALLALPMATAWVIAKQYPAHQLQLEPLSHHTTQTTLPGVNATLCGSA